MTIHFRGQRGRCIRENFLNLTIQKRRADGGFARSPVLANLTSSSASYTFSDDRGLLYSTQFAQPAIVLLEKAVFEDMKTKGVVQDSALFAGHSLGEYGVLSAIAEFMPFELMLDVIFYRGLAMSAAIKKNADGRTDFSMMAVSPARVGPCKRSSLHPPRVRSCMLTLPPTTDLTEAALRIITEIIAQKSGKLLEIVNFNIEGEQYVCAGHVSTAYNFKYIIACWTCSSPSQVTQIANIAMCHFYSSKISPP